MPDTQRRIVKCYRCGASITFDPAIRSENGVLIPLNVADGSKHDCPKSPYNLRRLRQQKPEAAA